MCATKWKFENQWSMKFFSLSILPLSAHQHLVAHWVFILLFFLTEKKNLNFVWIDNVLPANICFSFRHFGSWGGHVIHFWVMSKWKKDRGLGKAFVLLKQVCLFSSSSFLSGVWMWDLGQSICLKTIKSQVKDEDIFANDVVGRRLKFLFWRFKLDTF